MKKTPQSTSLKPLFLIPIFFAIAVTAIFFIRKDATMEEYSALTQAVPSIKNYGQNAVFRFKDVLDKYGALSGLALGAVYFILALIANLLFSIIRITRLSFGRYLALLLALAPLAYFGGNMVYVSSRLTATSAGIVLFIGYPLFYASIATAALILLFMIFSIFKKGSKIALSIMCLFVLSGCTDLLNLFIGATCDDGDYHCQQEVAVGQNDPDECDKMAQHPGFTGSNPPQDKCHMMVAQNNADEEICEGIKGGPGSYSVEQCKDSVEPIKNPELVVIPNTSFSSDEKEDDESAQVAEDKSTSPLAPAGTNLSSSQVEADIQTIADAAGGKYIELLELDIEGEDDPARLAGLEAYRDFLSESGETLENIQTNLDTLNELRRIFLDSYDPSMDIANMDVNEIIGPGLFDRMFGSDEEQSEEDRASDALTVYEAMLERQSEIDFLKQDRLSRVGSVISSNLQGQAADKVKETAVDIAKTTAGTAFTAVTFVGDALASFQAEAQNQIFIGLARAYDRRRSALAEERPNASADELHKLAIQQLREEPYRDAKGLTVIKYGNILENGECGSTNNPLCIQSDVFFTAMEQTWRYKNK